MNPISVISLLAAGYVAFILGSSNKATVKANSLRAQITDVDLDFQRIRITVNVQNPTIGNIVVRAIVGDLYVNGNKIANVYYSGYVNIPATGSNYFNIEGKYITQNMGQLIVQLFQGRQNFEIIFNGSVNVNSELMPMTFKYRLNG